MRWKEEGSDGKERREMKIVDVIWFSNSLGYLGIVVVEDAGTFERRAYIGRATGIDEGDDVHDILDWGSSFTLEMLKRIEQRLTKMEGC